MLLRVLGRCFACCRFGKEGNTLGNRWRLKKVGFCNIRFDVVDWADGGNGPGVCWCGLG